MLVVCHAEACRVMILFIGVSFQTYFITPCAREFLGGYVASVCPLLPFAHFLSCPGAPASPLPPARSPSFGLRPPLLSLQLAAGAALPPRPPGPAQSAGAPCGPLPPSPLGLATLRGMAAAAASPPVAAAAAATAAEDAIVPWC